MYVHVKAMALLRLNVANEDTRTHTIFTLFACLLCNSTARQINTLYKPYLLVVPRKLDQHVVLDDVFLYDSVSVIIVIVFLLPLFNVIKKVGAML